jgi:hypothetical protein
MSYLTNQNTENLKYLKTFESFINEEEPINEGFKHWLMGGLIALSSLGGVSKAKAQDKINTLNTETQVKTQQNENDIKKLLDYHYSIISKKDEFKQAKEGNYLVTKTDDFVALSGKNKYNGADNVNVTWGNPWSNEGKELRLTLYENGTISIYIDHIVEKDIDRGISGGITKAGKKVLNQFDLNKGDKGYDEAINIINIFSE